MAIITNQKTAEFRYKPKTGIEKMLTCDIHCDRRKQREIRSMEHTS